jgi:hypothetical protein
VCYYILQRYFVADPQVEGELPVEVAGFDAQHCRGDGHDSDGHAAGGQTPQADGPLFADFGVRRHALHRQNIQCRKELRGGDFAGRHQQIVECFDRLE